MLGSTPGIYPRDLPQRLRRNITRCYFFLPFSLFQQIDGEAFLLLTQNDIVNILKIKLGPALKIFNTIPKH